MREFRDRHEAGRLLGERLAKYAGEEGLIVLALPRGGVPVGFEVASRLGAPLDVFLVRKLGVPGQEELALGAIASGGVSSINHEVVEMLALSEQSIRRVAEREQQELQRRERAYRGSRPPLDLAGRTVVLVDDGLATGASMRAAALAVRDLSPLHLVIAVPVAPWDTCQELRGAADEVVCAATPEPFYAVGLHYVDFSEVSDDEVRRLLQAAESGYQARAA